MTTMKAIVQDTYGSSEVLELREIDQPTAGDGEVLVRVHAAGVSRGDVHLMTGEPYLMRLLGFGVRRPKNPVPGQDVAGDVVAVGPGVTRFRVGDEVFGIARGSNGRPARWTGLDAPAAPTPRRPDRRGRGLRRPAGRRRPARRPTDPVM